MFSPSDLNHYLECEHLLQLERIDAASGVIRRRDAHAELLAAKGLEYERAFLEAFRAQGRSLVPIDPRPGERDWEGDAARTLQAMRDGVDVIYQGVFVDQDWHGVSDFLVRVDRPSALGAWSYEAWDTKLARHSRPYFILQLCFYTEQLARLQRLEPEWMHVVLGTGERQSFLYQDFAAYHRAVRRRFLTAAFENRPTAPYPVAHCRLCAHAVDCEAHWHREDHLSLVAGIRRHQVQRLNDAGIVTVSDLASVETDARLGIGPIAFNRLVHQAALQASHRRTGIHRYELLPANAQNGFRLLPPRSPGDVFFDIEGYPFFEPAGGLEYLFGVTTIDRGAPSFQAFRASTRDEEKRAFEQFVDFIQARLQQWPDLHVYHYASYEPATLRRLMSQHATREDAVDDLLRREVFVDLYQVVRQSLRISHQSYSLKKVRTFFMAGAGQGSVTDGADSMLEFERWLRLDDPAILEAIERYNEEDCLSTLKLLEWLLDRKAELERASGASIPWRCNEPPKLRDERIEDDRAVLTRREQLFAHGNDASMLLADLLAYHRREAKPEWWAYFDRRKKSLDDLLDDTEAIAYLEPVPGVEPVKDERSVVHTLSFPPQEFKLAVDAKVDDPFRGAGAGTIAWIDSAAGRLGLKRGATRANEPLPVAIVTGKPLDSSVQRRALCRVADVVSEGRRPASAEGSGEARRSALCARRRQAAREFSAARALLQRELPRFRNRLPGLPIQTLDLDDQKSLVAELDESYLVIQGPPGSGKTWTGARLIVSLIAAGQRVGVAATSHKAIHNLLTEVEAVAGEERVAFRGLKKSSDGEETVYTGSFIASTSNNEECETTDASLVAGTSWLFAREGMQQQLDYLFVDEAGQVSLADAIAMGTSARNIVLLGDPQQLPHVTHGIHPNGSGRSVLEHVLGESRTIAEDRGLFLARSWRMHPDVCRFVSGLSYDGRLTSADGRANQRVASAGLSGAGLRFIAVNHEGNAQQSIEEANTIAEHVTRLLHGGTFTDVAGRTRPLTAADILVVAPYNMQVRCLREALPNGVEVGTVDKFQGREAAIVIFSMASSSGEDVPRGLEFLFNRNRFNVAVSRAKALAVVVCSPRLLDTRCRTVEQMRLVNALCRFAEEAAAPSC